MPGVIKKLLSGELAYVEETVLRRDKDTMDVQVVPNMLADKISFKGTLKVRPTGPGRCERVFDAEVNVKVMMVGGTIEKHIAEMIKKSYDVAAELMRGELAAPASGVGSG
jgi:hypothetical protein